MGVRRLLVCCLFVFLGTGRIAESATINLLSNAGFETGDFTGWTVGGNSISTGVATDGTAIAGADAPFLPNSVNVRSGTYAAFGLTQGFCCDTPEYIVLSQTVSVLPGQSASVGFYLGNDSQSGFGYTINDSNIQIFINGVGLNPADPVLGTGSTSSDFWLFSQVFNTGSNTSITATFQILGSGTSRVGVSLDDFFLISEDPSQVPEPSSLLLLGGGLAWGYRRLRRSGSPART